MKSQKKIVTNKDLSKLNSLQISVKAKYYIECITDSDIEEAFQFIKKNKIKFLYWERELMSFLPNPLKDSSSKIYIKQKKRYIKIK
jgi:hypothetical protein